MYIYVCPAHEFAERYMTSPQFWKVGWKGQRNAEKQYDLSVICPMFMVPDVGKVRRVVK